MNLKKFSIVLTALAFLGGTGAFAQVGVGVNTPLGGAGLGVGPSGIGVGANVLGAGANVGLGGGYDAYGNPLYVSPGFATSNVLTYPAVVGNTGYAVPTVAAPVSRPWFRLGLFGHGLRFGGRRACAVQTVNTMPMVIPNSCGSCQTITQPAVCEPPAAPQPQTVTLHDTITTTTTTRITTRRFPRVIRHYRKACAVRRHHHHACRRVRRACDAGS